MAKELRFGAEARALLLAGVNQLAEAVSTERWAPRAATRSWRRSPDPRLSPTTA